MQSTKRIRNGWLAAIAILCASASVFADPPTEKELLVEIAAVRAAIEDVDGKVELVDRAVDEIGKEVERLEEALDAGANPLKIAAELGDASVTLRAQTDDLDAAGGALDTARERLVKIERAAEDVDAESVEEALAEANASLDAAETRIKTTRDAAEAVRDAIIALAARISKALGLG